MRKNTEHLSLQSTPLKHSTLPGTSGMCARHCYEFTKPKPGFLSFLSTALPSLACSQMEPRDWVWPMECYQEWLMQLLGLPLKLFWVILLSPSSLHPSVPHLPAISGGEWWGLGNSKDWVPEWLHGTGPLPCFPLLPTHWTMMTVRNILVWDHWDFVFGTAISWLMQAIFYIISCQSNKQNILMSIENNMRVAHSCGFSGSLCSFMSKNGRSQGTFDLFSNLHTFKGVKNFHPSQFS